MTKSRKQKILENSLSIEDITTELKSYETGKEKAKFLREMSQLNLPYDINWENLAQCYDGTTSWPVFKKDTDKDENILSDSGVEVVTTMDDKPLTKEELEALI